MFPRDPRVPMGQYYHMGVGGHPPFQSFPRNQSPRRGAGGILSKLFSKQSVGNSFGAHPPGRVPGGFFSNIFSNNGLANNIGATNNAFQSPGGFLSNLITNPSSASGMLNNIQNAVNIANKYAPMIQQYGPMVKNIPALINLYREINSSDDDTNTSSKPEKTDEKDLPKYDNKKKIKDEAKETIQGLNRKSIPKLYI